MESRRIVEVLMNRAFADYRVRCTVRSSLMAGTIAIISAALLGFNLIYATLIFLLSLLLLLPAHGMDAWRFSLQSSLLGYVFVYSFAYACKTPDQLFGIFGRYLVCFSSFHFMEFMITAVTSPETLCHSSYLLDHSVTYWIAATGSWVEFFVECYLIPGIKIMPISYLGLVMICVGEMFRKLAMLHARGGFTHIVAQRKVKTHVLITDGVYGMVRHPGYVGWFLWCVGTQVLLCNPICAIIYTIAAWAFFRDRIPDEERLLIEFFGQAYRRYQQTVPLGIPFIRGFDEY